MTDGEQLGMADNFCNGTCMSIMDSHGIATLIKQDVLRWHVLGLVEALNLPEGCVGAGFVRNLVWDYHHGRHSDCREEDVDVLFFDKAETSSSYDAKLERSLRELAPEFRWSVKNQARMHSRNRDEPYTSIEDAMRYWTETATAVAAMRRCDECIIVAPFGTGDLTSMILRPTSALPRKVAAFHERVRVKKWLDRWPSAQFA